MLHGAGIFTNIHAQNDPNVGKYPVHQHFSTKQLGHHSLIYFYVLYVYVSIKYFSKNRYRIEFQYRSLLNCSKHRVPKIPWSSPVCHPLQAGQAAASSGLAPAFFSDQSLALQGSFVAGGPSQGTNRVWNNSKTTQYNTK